MSDFDKLICIQNTNPTIELPGNIKCNIPIPATKPFDPETTLPNASVDNLLKYNKFYDTFYNIDRSLNLSDVLDGKTINLDYLDKTELSTTLSRDLKPKMFNKNINLMLKRSFIDANDNKISRELDCAILTLIQNAEIDKMNTIKAKIDKKINMVSEYSKDYQEKYKNLKELYNEVKKLYKDVGDIDRKAVRGNIAFDAYDVAWRAY